MKDFDEIVVADYLNLDPNGPLYWPVQKIRRLLQIRGQYGHEVFLWYVYRFLRRNLR